jgi:hypothetical protein
MRRNYRAGFAINTVTDRRVSPLCRVAAASHSLTMENKDRVRSPPRMIRGFGGPMVPFWILIVLAIISLASRLILIAQ